MTQTPPQSPRQAAWFPGFDGLRTILALIVVCGHTEELKYFFTSFPRLEITFFSYEAVKSFLALSGFLITYLLLQEHAQTGQINIRQFYWKRVLRIWPLYYTITLLAFLVLPSVVDLADYPGVMQSFHQPTWWLYLVILPNVALLLYPYVLGASQLWSIGIEEQFYLIWPWFVRASRRYFPAVLLACIVAKPLLVKLAGRIIARLPGYGIVESPEIQTLLENVHKLMTLFPFEHLAWGGLFAWLVFSRNTFWPRLLGHPVSQVISWGALAFWIGAPVNLPLKTTISGLLHGLAIWNIGANPRTLIGLRAPWLNKFGALTYGFYMWHLLVIVAVFSVAKSWQLPSLLAPWAFNVLMLASVIGGTFLIAQLSLTWLEMPFLRLKTRWFGKPHAAPKAKALDTLATITTADIGTKSSRSDARAA